MIRKYVIKLVGSLTFIWIAIAFPYFSHGADSPFLLSKDHDNVFREEAFTSTSYFYFGKDGSYRQINREHMFVAEMDRGTWKQDATGVIELKSSIRMKKLKSGIFTVSPHNIDEFKARHSLEKDIRTFLEADERTSYSPYEIESAWMYSYTWSLFHSTKTFKAVHVDKGVERVTREQLVRLLDDWRAYLHDDTKNCFHFTPVRYDKYVLLASSDYSFIANAKTPEEAKKTATISVQVRKTRAESPPALVYVLVDSDSALQEMETNQPFIFHPEMNGKMGSEEVLRYE